MILTPEELAYYMSAASKLKVACYSHYRQHFGNTITPDNEKSTRELNDFDIYNIHIADNEQGIATVFYEYTSRYEAESAGFPVSSINNYLTNVQLMTF